MYLGYVIGDYFGVRRHVDAQEKILSQIIHCCWSFTVPGIFLLAEYVFVDYFGVPRQVDAQEKVLSQIID